MVDMLVLLFVCGAPFTEFIYEIGCFQWYVFLMSAFLVLPWICCMKMTDIITNPFVAGQDLFNFCSLMASSEQVTFHNLRVAFDFDLPVEDRSQYFYPYNRVCGGKISL